MILNQQDAEWAMLYFTNYFAQFERIDQYIKEQKLEQVKDFPFQLPGMADEDDFFNDFGMLPENMNFDIQEIDNDTFTRILNKVTSHTAMASIPGKAIRIIVKETNTNKIVGFIRFGSPMMNSKPRNQVLGRPLKTQDKTEMKRFNHAAIMGFTIVPTQPFGYNYLGGKLLASICCSHRIKKLIDDKYGTNICLFETTSLYGSSKSSSQYDGMKPYLRFKGVTESNFIPMLHGDSFTKIPELLKANSDKKIGIFIDGPKDSQQMDLRKVINRNNQEGNIVCIGYHDIGPITFGRIKDRKIYQSSIFDNNNLIHSHDLDFMSEEFLYLANKNKKLLGNMKLSLKDGFWPKGPGVMIEKI